MWRLIFTVIGIVVVIVSKGILYEIIGLGLVIMAGWIPKKKKQFRRVK